MHIPARPWNRKGQGKSKPGKGKGKGGKGKDKGKKRNGGFAVSDPYGGSTKVAKRSCFICGSTAHLANQCPDKKSALHLFAWACALPYSFALHRF